jgi:N-acetylglutamate synthase-like GNAT family acetyltransferase
MYVMGINVRAAVKEDCSEITHLTNQLGYPSTLEKICEIMDLVLSHKDHQVFIAEKENTIVGYIHLIQSIRIGSNPFVEIAAFIIDESSRSIGVGSSLIGESEKWASTLGLKDIRIRSNIIRKEAHKFFQNRGFQNLKTQEVFLKKVPNSSIGYDEGPS